MAQYLIPENLDLALFLGKSFRARCLNIINHLALRRKSGEGRYGYVNIHSADLKHLASGNYRIYLHFLIARGIIERNGSHCNNEMARYGTFSKSYRFALLYSKGFKVIELKGENVKPRLYDRTDKHDEVCVTLAENCCRLTLDHTALTGLAFETQNEALTLMAHLQAGSASVKRGKKVRRVYHRVNGASKDVRKMLRLGGEPLLEYDMKSAHPVLALSLYLDPSCAEALAYKELLNQDVYGVYGVSRDEAKKLLRKFFYSQKHGIRKNSTSANPVAIYFRTHFPILFAAITSFADLAVRLQNLESYLFNDFIVPRAHDLGLFYVSIHDGFVCVDQEAAKTITYLIQNEFEGMFRYRPEISLKLAANGRAPCLTESGLQ